MSLEWEDQAAGVLRNYVSLRGMFARETRLKMGGRSCFSFRNMCLGVGSCKDYFLVSQYIILARFQLVLWRGTAVINLLSFRGLCMKCVYT